MLVGQGVTDVPLCIDSSIVEVLEAGLAAYQGKALVNSVTAEDERLEAILPLVAVRRGGDRAAERRGRRSPRRRRGASSWPARSSTSPPTKYGIPSRTS